MKKVVYRIGLLLLAAVCMVSFTACSSSSDGKNGQTPYICENGITWCIGGEDTGIPVQGPPGESGNNGEAPYIGTNGNWWIGSTDTGISAQGPPGETGNNGVTPRVGANGNWFIGDHDTGISVQGPPGESGSSGITPHIGTNGNWWIGSTDTGIKAQGPPGESGSGEPGLSAYELYIKYNPEYTGTEKEWIDDLVNGRLGVELYDVNVPHIIINQVFGRGTMLGGGGTPIVDTGAIGSSHSFIELYNPTDNEVNLTGWSVQVAEGATFDNGLTGTDWNVLSLTGTIPSKHSYLIAQTMNPHLGANYVVGGWDLAWNDYEFPNKNLKVVLLKNTNKLSVVNPFDIDGQGRKVPGYVDMIGVAGNDAGTPPIDGCETASLRVGDAGVQSKQRAIRRINFADTDDNSKDLEAIDYRAANISATRLAAVRPRSKADGEWTYETITPPVRPDHLIVLQVFGGGGQADTAISHSFIELYNPTSSPISLNGYSVRYSTTGTSAKGRASHWQSISDTVANGVLEFNLPAGHTIPAGHSYLIRGVVEPGTPPALAVPIINAFDFDIGDRAIDNRDYRIAIVLGGVEINVIQVPHANNKHTTARRVDFSADDYQLYTYSGSAGQGSVMRTAADWTGTGATDLAALRPRSLIDGPWGL